MSRERIWAPDRMRYVERSDESDECIFCTKPALGDDQQALIVHRGERCFVMLNLYPYTNGHSMVAPYEHCGRLQDLDPGTTTEMMGLVQGTMRAIDGTYEPKGFNVGVNQGRSGGAGVEHHIHMHVVPRWPGDTNFMPVLADTKVMPQSLADSYAILREALGG